MSKIFWDKDKEEREKQYWKEVKEMKRKATKHNLIKHQIKLNKLEKEIAIKSLIRGYDE